uniref:Uncharacterized protein MANES_18G080100 n=1 Tax=Rhizophora mucronata TaxID=61149 RepID=A0A2P2MS16_RHIMU
MYAKLTWKMGNAMLKITKHWSRILCPIGRIWLTFHCQNRDCFYFILPYVLSCIERKLQANSPLPPPVVVGRCS